MGKTFGLYALIRGAKVTCPASAHDGCKPPFDDHLIRQLPRRFALLSRALTELVRVVPANVIVPAYPDPLRNRQGAMCGDPGGFHPDSPWAGAHSQLPLRGLSKITHIGRDWDFNIRSGEARELSRTTLPNLRRAVESSAEAAGFTAVPATADAFVGHCWTEADPGDAPTALPSASPSLWTCNGLPNGSPACWKPFAPRRRYIRTLNDALLTQSSERADDSSGAVHPTAQGHAAIADAVFTAAVGAPAFTARQ